MLTSASKIVPLIHWESCTSGPKTKLKEERADNQILDLFSQIYEYSFQIIIVALYYELSIFQLISKLTSVRL
jgi:hypothetical protein